MNEMRHAQDRQGGAGGPPDSGPARSPALGAARGPGPDAGGLEEAMLASDPLVQFAQWMADAVAEPLPEPTARGPGPCC